MMATNFLSHVFRDGNTAFFASDVVHALDFGGSPVAVSIADNQVLLGEGLGEIEATAEKGVPVDRRAEHGALLRHASLDRGFDTRDVVFLLRAKVYGIPFQAGQDDGLNEFGIIGHHSVCSPRFTSLTERGWIWNL